MNISIIEPTSTKFQLFNNISIDADTRSVFSCHAPDSNPKAEITWFKNGFPITSNSISHRQSNQTTVFTKNNEYDTRSYISFDVKSVDHMKELRCDVRVGSIPRTMHGSLMLDVKFPPEIFKMPPNVISIRENKTFKLNLTSRANPAPTYSCSALNVSEKLKIVIRLAP